MFFDNHPGILQKPRNLESRDYTFPSTSILESKDLQTVSKQDKRKVMDDISVSSFPVPESYKQRLAKQLEKKWLRRDTTL